MLSKLNIVIKEKLNLKEKLHKTFGPWTITVIAHKIDGLTEITKGHIMAYDNEAGGKKGKMRIKKGYAKAEFEYGHLVPVKKGNKITYMCEALEVRPGEFVLLKILPELQKEKDKNDKDSKDIVGLKIDKTEQLTRREYVQNIKEIMNEFRNPEDKNTFLQTLAFLGIAFLSLLLVYFVLTKLGPITDALNAVAIGLQQVTNGQQDILQQIIQRLPAR